MVVDVEVEPVEGRDEEERKDDGTTIFRYAVDDDWLPLHWEIARIIASRARILRFVAIA